MFVVGVQKERPVIAVHDQIILLEEFPDDPLSFGITQVCLLKRRERNFFRYIEKYWRRQVDSILCTNKILSEFYIVARFTYQFHHFGEPLPHFTVDKMQLPKATINCFHIFNKVLLKRKTYLQNVMFTSCTQILQLMLQVEILNVQYKLNLQINLYMFSGLPSTFTYFH